LVNGGIAGACFILEKDGQDGLLTHHTNGGFVDHLDFHIVFSAVEGMFGRRMDLQLGGSILSAIHIFDGAEGSTLGILILELDAEHIGVVHYFNFIFCNIIVIKLCI
jgi:hypothetical protein